MTVVGPATESEREELVRLRRDFHAHPELMYEEVRTSRIVSDRMRELGLEVTDGVAETGVLASRGEGARRLLLRADMDALPILEANDVEYRSRNDGVMHACGHDAHTAIGMVAAARFAQAKLPGAVRFAFQPAEEGGNGADRMIEEGALEGVDAALGLHVWNVLPVGKVGVQAGPVMAAVDIFEIDVHGRGGHAAMPHQTVDPIVAAAGLIRDLQTIVSRRVSPFDSAVVSVTAIEGGTAFNVIPDDVKMKGTIRSFSTDVRDAVHRDLREMVEGRGTVRIESVTIPLVNDARMCEIVRRAAVDVVGEENVVDDVATMGGEDFASVLANVPGCFFFVGSGPGEPGPAHHNPHFDIDERSLPIGLEILCRSAHDYLERGFA